MRDTDRFSTRVFALAVVALLAYPALPDLRAVLRADLLGVPPRLHALSGQPRGCAVGSAAGRALAATLLTLAVTLGIAVPVVARHRRRSRGRPSSSATASRRRPAATRSAGLRISLKLPGDRRRDAMARGPCLRRRARRSRRGLVQGAQRGVQFLLARSGDLLFGALGIVGGLTLTLFILFFFFRDGDVMAAPRRGLIPLDDATQGPPRPPPSGRDAGRGLRDGGDRDRPGRRSLGHRVLDHRPAVAARLRRGRRRSRRSCRSWERGSSGCRRRSTSAPTPRRWKPIFLVVWSALVVGSADNFLRPLLVSGKSQIGTLTVFFGVLGGLAAFGFIGLFVGPVILALVLSLLEFVGGARVAAPRRRPEPPADESVADPVRHEDVGLVRLLAVAVGGEDEALAVAGEHREAVEVGAERDRASGPCRPRGSTKRSKSRPFGSARFDEKMISLPPGRKYGAKLAAPLDGDGVVVRAVGVHDADLEGPRRVGVRAPGSRGTGPGPRGSSGWSAR